MLPGNPGKKKEDNRILSGSVVCYEQHGMPKLAVALREQKGKWRLLNSAGAELQLAAARLYVYDARVDSTDKNTVKEFLAKFLGNLDARRDELLLKDMWELCADDAGEYSVQDLTRTWFGKDGPQERALMHHGLIADRIYFKRTTKGFQPRKPAVVEELMLQAAAEARRQEEQQLLTQVLVENASGGNSEFPPTIRGVVDLAVHGSKAPRAKEWSAVVESALGKLKLKSSGKAEEKAFTVLVACGYFTEDENMLIRRLGRGMEFPPEVEGEARELVDSFDQSRCYDDRADFRNCRCYTIDGADTKDFDDALTVKRTPEGNIEVGIHISDVSAVVPAGEILDKESALRATSIYCPDAQYPMLPLDLSHDVLSLQEGEPRLAQSFLVEFDVERNIVRREIKPGIITVSRRLTYEEVDSLLCDEQAPDDDVVRDLLSLWDVASAYEGHRLERGAYQFARKEVWPALDESGVIRLETAQEETPARKLVSELMVLANETAALFAREQGLPMLFRTQEPPEEVSEERVMAVPEGPARDYVARSGLKRSLLSTEPLVHSGLGLDAYVHVTSPIRRYIDLVNQRQLMARLEGQSEFYRAKELAEAGAQVDTSLGEARTIQRDRTRYWLMKYIRQEKIKELEAVVVKVDGPRPLAEVSLFAMMFPFRNQAHGAKTKRKPGDRITLRVRDVDPLRDILTLVDAD